MHNYYVGGRTRTRSLQEYGGIESPIPARILYIDVLIDVNERSTNQHACIHGNLCQFHWFLHMSL